MNRNEKTNKTSAQNQGKNKTENESQNKDTKSCR